MASLHRIHAMKEAHVGVAVVCWSKHYVVFDNGLQLPIQGWLDDNHKPTRDGAKARFFEFGDDEHGYGIGDYEMYRMPSYKDH